MRKVILKELAPLAVDLLLKMSVFSLFDMINKVCVPRTWHIAKNMECERLGCSLHKLPISKTICSGMAVNLFQVALKRTLVNNANRRP